MAISEKLHTINIKNDVWINENLKKYNLNILHLTLGRQTRFCFLSCTEQKVTLQLKWCLSPPGSLTSVLLIICQVLCCKSSQPFCIKPSPAQINSQGIKQCTLLSECTDLKCNSLNLCWWNLPVDNPVCHTLYLWAWLEGKKSLTE